MKVKFGTNFRSLGSEVESGAWDYDRGTRTFPFSCVKSPRGWFILVGRRGPEGGVVVVYGVRPWTISKRI